MKQKIVILSEKPSLDQALASHAVKRWPNTERIFLHTLSLGAARFKYPRGLAWHEYPFVSEPRYALNPEHAWLPVRVLEDGKVEPAPDVNPLEELKTSNVIFGGDPDHTGAMAFRTILQCVRGDEGNDFPALNLVAFDDRSLERSFATMGNFVDMFDTQIRYGETKRYVDWNWNVNALAILGRALIEAGVQTKAPFISKFALQFLYYIEDHPAQTERGLVEAMTKWNGSGKYAVSRSFGSVMSRAAIVEQLYQLDLIERDSSTGQVVISKAGQRFLSILHKDCRDPDLPTRLSGWCEAGLGLSKDAIDRYIRTFFGKQMRHFSTMRRAGKDALDG